MDLLGPDYLARLKLPIPRDLRAKCDPSDMAHEALLGACRDLDQFDGDTEGKGHSALRVQTPGLRETQIH
ncbi:MAG TPA: hypothetical protein VG099_15930 [Gemmataceae bacterium]|nr:hypothetical protein [Gemmataceae bacterium]